MGYLMIEELLLRARGMKTPKSATYREWQLYHLTYRHMAPIQYAIFRTLPRIFKRAQDKLTGMLAYIHNRWIEPTHKITINDSSYHRGIWYDRDSLMLYACFQILIDFVELECGRDKNFETVGQKIYRKFRYLPVLGWFFPAIRNARQGLHYLRWSMKLKDHPSQAEFAKNVFKLYRWWKRERPNRQDPWKKYTLVREGRDWMGALTPKEKKLLNKAQKEEDKYEREDEKMLHLLVRIRKGMWT